MQPPTRLSGVGAKVVAPHVPGIDIAGCGAADVRAYAEAVKYADRLRVERLARSSGRRPRRGLPATWMVLRLRHVTSSAASTLESRVRRTPSGKHPRSSSRLRCTAS